MPLADECTLEIGVRSYVADIDYARRSAPGQVAEPHWLTSGLLLARIGPHDRAICPHALVDHWCAARASCREPAADRAGRAAPGTGPERHHRRDGRGQDG